MKQTSDSINKMSSIPLLKGCVDSPAQQQRMRSVESQKGQYSEFTLWGPGINGDICRHRLDPFSLLLMSTNPQDKALKAKYIAEGMSRVDAINRILAERGIVA